MRLGFEAGWAWAYVQDRSLPQGVARIYLRGSAAVRGTLRPTPLHRTPPHPTCIISCVHRDDTRSSDHFQSSACEYFLFSFFPCSYERIHYRYNSRSPARHNKYSNSSVRISVNHVAVCDRYTDHGACPWPTGLKVYEQYMLCTGQQYNHVSCVMCHEYDIRYSPERKR